MAIEKRKAVSLLMKLIVKSVRNSFSELSFSDRGEDFDWQLIRDKMDEKEKSRKRKKGTAMLRKEISGVPAEITASTGAVNRDFILYLHGGAFVLGIAFYHRKYAEALACHTGRIVVMPDYSLAPENKFPAALDECERLYHSLRKQHLESNIVLAGDSAGGGLCVSLTMRLKEKGEKLPQALVLHSPVIDLSGKLDHSINDDINNDFLIKPGTGNTVNKAYIGDADPAITDISPYYGDFGGFPPVFITCETRETLYADSVELDRRLEQAGVTVRTIELDGGYHTYGTLGDLTIETRHITKEIADFIEK